MLDAPLQTTLADGVPLAEVTFCVVDLETTGGSPTDSAITEVGAVKVRGGERLGTFRSFVDPERPIPRRITHLTGIEDHDVRGEPPIQAVLPAFLEFVRGSVFVAHNARFDFGFLNANLARCAYDALPPPPVCTAKLARRIVWPDVPNVRLKTLAGYFRTRVQPIHRALDDAEACAEVFQGLLEAAGRLGILTLGDLHEACRARGRPNYGKIRLADDLPRAPGVYRFLDRDGHVLYVGKSTDLRARVRSYFYGDGRKKVEDLLTATTAVRGERCATELEALVVEARRIREHEPRFNRRGKTWRRYAYLRLDPSEAFPRLKVVRTARPGDGSAYLGPFGNGAQARLAKEAIEEVVPIRRCTTAMSRSTRFAPCALADMGRCTAPCEGRIGPERYGELVRGLVSSLSAPGGLLGALEARIVRLAQQERFEEAALARDRLRALADALWRKRIDAWLVGAGRLELRDLDGQVLTFDAGALRTVADVGVTPDPLASPCARERADELAAVRSWLVAHPGLRVEACDRPPAERVDGGRALHRVLATLRAAGRDRDGEDGPRATSPAGRRGRRR
ncbi:MAG: DEDD exonuclease domain-containing protein [Actinomycetota bacterium]